MYNALQQFFKLFPNLQRNDFVVVGESYGGKYAPAIAYTIHQNNPAAKLKINLQGIGMGNGFSDPEHQLGYSEYLYQIGLIDFNTKLRVGLIEQQCLKLVKEKQYLLAFKLMDDLMDGDMNGNKSLFQNTTGFKTYYNILVTNSEEGLDYLGAFIQRTDVRKAIHVGNLTFHTETGVVEEYLANDVMQSVAPWISELLSHYNVLVYNGQLDIIVAYPLTINYLRNLQFSGADEYKKAARHIWTVDGDIAGYVKQAGNLTEVLVRNAGHMVPGDQPQWAFDLITRFTHRKPFY